MEDLLPDIRFFEAVRTSREKYAMDEREEQGLTTAADVRLLIAQAADDDVATASAAVPVLWQGMDPRGPGVYAGA